MLTKDPRSPEKGEREAALVHLLQQVWTYTPTTRGDDARSFADELAEGASRGYLTTAIIPHGTVYGRRWKLTPEGLAFLFSNSNLLTEEEVRYAEAHCTR